MLPRSTFGLMFILLAVIQRIKCEIYDNCKFKKDPQKKWCFGMPSNKTFSCVTTRNCQSYTEITPAPWEAIRVLVFDLATEILLTVEKPRLKQTFTCNMGYALNITGDKLLAAKRFNKKFYPERSSLKCQFDIYCNEDCEREVNHFIFNIEIFGTIIEDVMMPIFAALTHVDHIWGYIEKHLFFNPETHCLKWGNCKYLGLITASGVNVRVLVWIYTLISDNIEMRLDLHINSLLLRFGCNISNNRSNPFNTSSETPFFNTTCKTTEINDPQNFVAICAKEFTTPFYDERGELVDMYRVTATTSYLFVKSRDFMFDKYFGKLRLLEGEIHNHTMSTRHNIVASSTGVDTPQGNTAVVVTTGFILYWCIAVVIIVTSAVCIIYFWKRKHIITHRIRLVISFLFRKRNPRMESKEKQLRCVAVSVAVRFNNN